MIPQPFIQDLLYRADITEVVGRYVQLKKAGGNLSGLCPFHKEKSPSFTVSPAKQFYHCFGCGVHGTAITFLMEHLGLPFPEAVEHLAAQIGMSVPQVENTTQEIAQRSRQAVLLERMQQAQQFYKRMLKTSEVAVSYLKNRGLTGQVASQFGIGYAPGGARTLSTVFTDYDATQDLIEAGLVIQSEEGGRRYDRFRERVMFPIRNSRGDIIGFGGRIIAAGEPKYLNSPETLLFSKGQELYGLFEARPAIRERSYALVVEGYMDVVALAQWGFENAVATLGTAVTPTHVQRLFRQTDRVVFSFDGDSAGKKAAWRALEACLPHVSEERRIEFIFLTSEHDPDSYIREFGADAFELQVSGAMPLSQFLIKEMAVKHSLSDVEGRSAAVAMLRPLVQQIPPSAYRVALVRALSEPLQSSPAELEQHFGLRKKNGQAVHYTPPHRKERVRAGSVDPEKRVAALLMLAPQLAENCQEYAQQLEGSPSLSDSQRGLVALIFSMLRNSFANVGSIMELFRNSAHSSWVGSVIYDSVLLDSNIEPESELIAAMSQCWDRWIAQELERLVSTGLQNSDTRESYRYWSKKRILLKQNRINSI